jgi:DNA primase
MRWVSVTRQRLCHLEKGETEMNLRRGRSRMDILELAGKDTHLKPVASTEGEEYAGPCPKCGGSDRFRVWPNHSCGQGRFWCRRCGEAGDALDYLIWTRGISSFQVGLYLLGLDPDTELTRSSGSLQTILRHRKLVTPPPPLWQEPARRFVERSVDNLWSPIGQQALQWLRGCGFSDETIKEARLGYNPSSECESWDAWSSESCDSRQGVWLPEGVVIPWESGGSLWRVSIRRPVPETQIEKGCAKYTVLTASRSAIYNADALRIFRPAILVEGELDALLINQQAGDVITAMATGSTACFRKPTWIARLALCSRVLVAHDADEAGDHAANRWLRVLANANRWRPRSGDATAMVRDGIDLRKWVAAGLDLAEAASQAGNQERAGTEELWAEAEALLARYDGSSEWDEAWQAMKPLLHAADRAEAGTLYPLGLFFADNAGLAVVGDQWRRLPDGRIEVIYRTAQELVCALFATARGDALVQRLGASGVLLKPPVDYGGEALQTY